MIVVAVALEDAGALQQLAFVLQLTLGLTFLVAAGAKLRRPAAFVATVTGYEIVGPRLARVVSACVIVVECALAVALLTGSSIGPALVLAAVTLVGFAAATAISLRRGRDVSCGCFGGRDEAVSKRGLVRISLLLGATGALALALASDRASAITVGDVWDEGFDVLAYLIAVGGITAAVMLASALALQMRELAPLLRRVRNQPSRRPARSQSQRSSV
ncbi:MAG TPA: MauE/DoxX family redox-associated membrane protein [Solirubrobacter sp.]|nr:MauE/DoxX family redox-associated membrane protein [Solirubrobacter sp.]